MLNQQWYDMTKFNQKVLLFVPLIIQFLISLLCVALIKVTKFSWIHDVK